MSKKKKVLFICTGNACRSQIAHGLLRELAGDQYEVFSAGSNPSQVHPVSISVMEEIGIDISDHTSDHVDDYLDNGMYRILREGLPNRTQDQKVHPENKMTG